MAQVKRFYGVNFGELAKTGAGQQPITSAVATTNKNIEIVIDLGDTVGPTAAFNVHKDRALVISHVQALLDFLETTAWPPART